MSREPRPWIKGLAWGCGVLVAIPVLGTLAIGVRTCAPLRSAQVAEARLEERFGPPGSFTPTGDGAVPEERLRVFLQVREDLSATCTAFETMLARMARVENLDEQNVTGEEIAGTTGGFARTAVGIAPAIGEFFEARNGALLEHGMGLGEYTYIFALAYREQLLDPRHLDSMFSEGRPIAPEATAVLREILANQARGRETTLLAEEIASMQDDPDRLPWQDRLPGALAESLAPHRDALDTAFCRATAGVEADLTSRRAMALALY